jgi:uncharacterized protein
MFNAKLKFIEASTNKDGSYSVPYWEIDSGIPGASLLISGAMHGNEVQGSEIIRRFKLLLEEQMIKGKCYLIPFVNPKALRRRQAHIDFTPGRSYSRDRENNLNCAWPGNENGSDTQRLAYAVFNSPIIKDATHCVDLHCWQSMRDSAIIPRYDNAESMTLAKASRLPFIIYKTEQKTKAEPHFPCLLSDYYNDSGRVGLCVEFSGQFGLDNQIIDYGTTAMLNIAKKLGMVEGNLEGNQELPCVINEHNKVDITAPVSGIFVRSNCEFGTKVSKGELLGHIFNEENLESYEITSPVNGVLFRYEHQYDSSLYSDTLSAYHAHTQKDEIIAEIVEI